MPGKALDFETIRELALDLPGVKESTAYGSPAFKLRGKLLAVIPTHKSAEPGSLGVTVDFERRADLIAGAPDVYYLPEHYVNYPIVLARLSRMNREALRDLLGGAWRFLNLQASDPRRSKVKRPAPGSTP